MKYLGEEFVEMIMRWVVILFGVLFLFWLSGVAGWLDIIKPYFDKYVNIFSGIGYLAVIFGLTLTILQIIAAKKQIRASISYRIHQDGREIRNSIKDSIVKIIESPFSCRGSQEQENEAEKVIREMLMYFSAVYHQYAFGNIDKSEWKLLEEQLFNFLENNRVEVYWKNKISGNPSWHKGLVSLGNDFINEKKRRKI